MSHPPLPVVVCLKWGEKYPTLYTNILYRAICETTSAAFRFVCITDHAPGLDAGIETIDLPPFALERALWTKGMWPKLSIFKAGLFAPGTPVLYIDLDVVVSGDLAPIFDHLRTHPGLHTPKGWPDTHERWFPRLFRRQRITHGAVIGFTAGEQDHLYELIKDRGPDVIDEWDNDQPFIHYQARDQGYLPQGWVLSFKKSLAFHFPVSLWREPSRPPPDCLIVSFHGRPNPQDCVQAPFRRWGSAEKFGFFPVSWIKAYWQRHAGPPRS